MTPLLARLQDGSWLDRRLVGAAGAVLFAVQLAMLAFIVAGTHGLIVPMTRPTTTDFSSFYAAGSLARAGTPELAYNEAAEHAAQEAATEPGVTYLHFTYPPVFLLICAPLAFLPYLVAFALFGAIGLVFYLAVARRVLDDPSAAALAALAAYPLVFWTLGFGQNSFLTAGLFGAATLFVDRRPVVAGLLFGALCFKPQFGLFVPFALAAAGRWNSIFAAALAAAALAGLSLALFGVVTWQEFLREAATAHLFYENPNAPYFWFANPFGAVRQLGGSVALAYAVQSVTTLIVGIAVVAAWRRPLSLTSRAAVLIAGVPIAVPMSLAHDLMLGAIAACWLIRDRGSPAAVGWEVSALVGLFLVLLDGRAIAENWHLPVFPTAAFAIFVIAGLRAWREFARPAAATRPSAAAVA